MQPIEITGIWLSRRGGENDPKAQVEVHAEVNGVWRLVITEPLNANFSHAVSPDGIRNAPVSEFQQAGGTRVVRDPCEVAGYHVCGRLESEHLTKEQP